MTPSLEQDINGKIAQATNYHYNLSQEAIVTTEDKIRIILITHLASVEARKDWIAPLGLVIAILLVFVTADFKNALGMDAATWRAIFFISGIICLGWLIWAIIRSLKSKTINDIISEFKSSDSKHYSLVAETGEIKVRADNQ